jgi:hypothetical protein
MDRAHYAVPADRRGDVARALLAAADDPIHEVRTSDLGFYVPEHVWEKAFPPADDDDDDQEQGSATPAKPARSRARR